MYSGFFSDQNSKDPHPCGTDIQMRDTDNECNEKVNCILGKRVVNAVGKERKAESRVPLGDVCRIK